MSMTRRDFLATGGAAMLLGGCAMSVNPAATAQLDARVNTTHDFLVSRYPGTARIMADARGVLYIPLMTAAGFGIGGAYGEGALRIGGATVDYYAATQASVGFQAGAQQFAHVLIFRTEQALAAFRASQGWVAGAGAYYAAPDGGMAIGSDTITAQQPVVAVIFGQSGLMAGATIEGTKYTRLLPANVAQTTPVVPRLQLPWMMAPAQQPQATATNAPA
ncbi:YSC84-related protein [Paracoccus sp. (in: a-proteobacteria)]|uniref:lipid-binding SYLF domain-containing protein n=1 Tax=Paracoccus sp. TaxID=267 RepID=UPI0034CF8884